MSEPFDRALRAAARRGRAAGVCPDAALLASYADNGLSADERRQIEAHAADCATCLEHLTLLGAISIERETPEPSRSWLARWGWLVPVATAVLVVAVWTRLPDQERSGIPATPVTAPAVPEREIAAAATDKKDSYDSGASQPRTATKVGQAAELRRPAQPADSKFEQLRPLERRDVARQNAAKAPPAVASSPPGALPVQAQEASAERARPLVGGAADKVASPRASAAAAAPAAEDAVKEEVKLADSGRRRESDQLMSKAVASPLGVSASPKESYRAVANRIELSEDGGATWRVAVTVTHVTFTAAACAPGGPCWFGATDGLILRRTPDRFSTFALPVRARIVAITPDGSQTAVVTVESGARFRTADGGATWVPIP